MTGRCDFLHGARVRCGQCDKVQTFSGEAGGGDNMARKAGWTIVWRPQPFVRCPKCQAPKAAGEG